MGDLAVIGGNHDQYRYSLMRSLTPPMLETGVSRRVVWGMLNPSKADAETNDPTIVRVCDFSVRLGCTDLEVVNMFAERATDPRALLVDVGIGNFHAHVGVDNWAYQLTAVVRADVVVCAWGNGKFAANGSERQLFNGAKHSLFRAFAAAEELLGRPLNVVNYGITKAGEPKHPLYLKADTLPAPYSWERAQP